MHVQPLTGRVAWAKKEEKGKGKGYHPPVPRLVARVNMIGSGPILGKRSKFFKFKTIWSGAIQIRCHRQALPGKTP